jgi:hypothetical protein
MDTITLSADTDQERANDRLGLCPSCMAEPTLLQPGSGVFGACLECKLAWYLTREQSTEAERDAQQARAAQGRVLEECSEVKPTYNADTLARMQARKEWEDAEKERVNSGAARALDTLLGALTEEQRTAFLQKEWATGGHETPYPDERLRSLAHFLIPKPQPFPEDVEAERFQRSGNWDWDDGLPF